MKAFGEKPVVYVSARFQDILEARRLANELRLRGVETNSEWLDETPNDHPSYAEDRDGGLARRALIDYAGVLDADALVLYNPPGRELFGTGGCHVETGVALGNYVPVHVVGKRSNIFHFLAGVRVWENTAEGLNRLAVELGGRELA